MIESTLGKLLSGPIVARMSPWYTPTLVSEATDTFRGTVISTFPVNIVLGGTEKAIPLGNPEACIETGPLAPLGLTITSCSALKPAPTSADEPAGRSTKKIVGTGIVEISLSPADLAHPRKIRWRKVTG